MSAGPTQPPPPGPPPGWGPPPGQPPGPPPGQPPGWGPPTGPPPRRGGRGRVIAAVVAAVVVVALAITVPLLLVGDDEDDETGGGDGGGGEPTSATTDGTDPAEEAEPTLDDVRTYNGLRTTHVTEEVEYSETPPAGGEHDPAWLDCGVYDEPVRDENAVHDLEHGSVWITYDPGLSDEDVDTLAAALPENGIMSPYEGLPSPVVVTVWERQLWLTGADDQRLALFVDEFGAGETAPEPFASCVGGITP